MSIKPIALYFPQFHRIQENDAWWGEGFTDWTNVKGGYPLFEGHRQPRVPLNEDYYDLSDVEIIRRQAALAKEYGLYGFAIYHYWFDGKQLLEKPKELLLEHKEIDIPFCLTWANESWCRRWEGNDKTILQLQTHEPTKEKWKEHFDYLLPYFQDARAIRIDGKVLFQIYRPHLVDEVGSMITYWRELAAEQGFELYFMAVKSFDFPHNSVLDNFDGVLLFQPAEATNSKQIKGKRVILENLLRHLPEKWVERLRSVRTKTQASYRRYEYKNVADSVLTRDFCYKDKDIFNMAFLEWDNTARYREKATVYHGCTPALFEDFFRKLSKKATPHQDGSQYVYINAWNEWAEGTYLEPDTDHKYEYLQALKNAVDSDK